MPQNFLKKKPGEHIAKRDRITLLFFGLAIGCFAMGIIFGALGLFDKPNLDRLRSDGITGEFTIKEIKTEYAYKKRVQRPVVVIRDQFVKPTNFVNYQNRSVGDKVPVIYTKSGDVIAAFPQWNGKLYERDVELFTLAALFGLPAILFYAVAHYRRSKSLRK